jgi:fucose 4-O-acetylase-like acetyltransferase
MDEVSRMTRRFDLDRLRFLAVLLLVPFHGALFFVHDPAYISGVKDAEESEVLKTAVDLVYQLHMPFLFFIAGASTWFALASRTAAAYLRERTLRLLVLTLFGRVALVPPMLYVRITRFLFGVKEAPGGGSCGR